MYVHIQPRTTHGGASAHMCIQRHTCEVSLSLVAGDADVDTRTALYSKVNIKTP